MQTYLTDISLFNTLLLIFLLSSSHPLLSNSVRNVSNMVWLFSVGFSRRAKYMWNHINVIVHIFKGEIILTFQVQSEP